MVESDHYCDSQYNVSLERCCLNCLTIWCLHGWKTIEKQYTSDGKMCCTKLFEDWLNTENGVSPKTWQTLLTQLNEVEGLADKVKEIIKRLGGTYAL